MPEKFKLVAVQPAAGVQVGVDTFSQGLTTYLSHLNLPTANVCIITMREPVLVC